MDLELGLFLPEDRENYRSLLIQHRVKNRAILETLGVDIHALESPAVLHRSHVVKGMYDAFTEILSQEAPNYQSTISGKSKQIIKSRAFHAKLTRLAPGVDLYSAGKKARVSPAKTCRTQPSVLRRSATI